MKISCRLLVSTCLITTSCVWGADELRGPKKLLHQTVLTTPVSAPKQTHTKTLTPHAKQVRRDPTNDDALWAEFMSNLDITEPPKPSTPSGSAKRKEYPIVDTSPGRAPHKYADELSQDSGKRLPVSAMDRSTASLKAVRAPQDLRTAQRTTIPKIEVPSTVPALNFAILSIQNNLRVNLNVQGGCISHDVNLETLGQIGSRQVFVSGDFVTTLTPSEGGFIAIQIIQRGRIIADGRYKIDSHRRVLQVDSLSLDSDIALSYDGDIVIDRIRTSEKSFAKLYITSPSSVLFGSDVATHLGELCISAKTFRNKGDLTVQSLKMSADEFINDGDLVCDHKIDLSAGSNFTNNGNLKISDLTLHTKEFVNDGIILANALRLNLLEKGRNGKLIKATTIVIDSKQEFVNSGGEHDALCLVDKNAPEGLWGLHAENIYVNTRVLNNRDQGIIWASKQIKVESNSINNSGYIRSLEDVVLVCQTYQDTNQLVLRKDQRQKVAQLRKASLVAYKDLKMTVAEGKIESSIYGEHSIELIGKDSLNQKITNSGFISTPGRLLIKKLKLINSGKIQAEAKITSESGGSLDNRGDIMGGEVSLDHLTHGKSAVLNCQELTLRSADVEGLISAKQQITLAGNIDGRGTLKSHNILRCADGLRSDISIQCRLEGKDINLNTSHGLTLASLVGEAARIKANYLDIPSTFGGDKRYTVTLKKLWVDVDPQRTISVAVPLSVTDVQLTLNAKQVTLGHLNTPLGLKLTAEKVFLNGDIAEATAQRIQFEKVKELHIDGSFIAPDVYFHHALERLTIRSAGRVVVKNFHPTVKYLAINGTLKASEKLRLSDCKHIEMKGPKEKKAYVNAGDHICIYRVQMIDLDNVEIVANDSIFGGGREYGSLGRLKIGKEVKVISESTLFIDVKAFEVDETGGVSARQGNVFQGREVRLDTLDGEIHYHLLRMGLRTLEGGKLTIVTNGELSLPAFEDGGFSFHHGHFKAKKVELVKAGDITIWSGDMTIEFQPDAPKMASADPNDAPRSMFEIAHHTVILGKLTVPTSESRVVIDCGATLDVRRGMSVNSLRNRGTLISTGGENVVAQKFLNHGKATLSNLDVWNFESSQREWGRPNFNITGDLKIQRYFAMYGGYGWVERSIIFHQGNSRNEWSGYGGWFRLCPVRPGDDVPWLTTRQEPSPIDRTKMDTFPILHGDGRGSRLVVGQHIYSPEGKKLERFDIVASELVVRQTASLTAKVIDARSFDEKSKVLVDIITKQFGVMACNFHSMVKKEYVSPVHYSQPRYVLVVRKADVTPAMVGLLSLGVSYDVYELVEPKELKSRVRVGNATLNDENGLYRLPANVLSDPTQPDALVLRSEDVEGFKIRVINGYRLEQVTPLRLNWSVVYSEDNTPTIEVYALELSQAMADSMGRHGISVQNLAAAYVGVPRFVISQVSGNAPRGPLGGQGPSPAAMFHVYNEMNNAAGIPFMHRDSRSKGEDFAMTLQQSGVSGLTAARARIGEQRFALEIKDIESAKQALQAFMSLAQPSQSSPQLTETPNAVDIARLEQMLDDSELMREFKADVKEITGLHHELISAPEAQRIVKARQGVVDKLSKDGFELLELTPTEMQQFLAEGDSFYTERVFIEGRWVDLARIAVSEATRRYWGSDFKGLKVGQNLHLTSQNGSALFGLIEAQQDLIITVHKGDLELGPQDENTISIIGGRRRTILHVKDGQLLLHPGVKLLGQQVILMADNGISLSPLVIETWRSKTDRSGFLWLGSTRTTTKVISYKERFTLDDGRRGIIIYSKDGDVNVSGSHIGNELSPVVLLAGGNVLMGPLLTDTYHQVDDKGVFSRNTTTARGQTAKATKISNIPNAVTLDKVMARPDILEAVLADILGVSTERHRRLLLTDKDAKALRQGTVIIRAMGNVTGKAINLATAFAEISAGKAISLTAVDTVQETHSEGWSIDFFNGIGSAICSLFDSQTKEAVKDTAELEEEAKDRAIAERMGAFTAIFYAMIEHMLMEGVQKAITAMPQGAIETWVSRRQQGHADPMPAKLWNVIRPFAAIVTANGSSIVESIVTFARLTQQQHDLAGLGMAMTVVQGVIEGFRFVDALKSIEAKGFEEFLSNGFEGLAKDLYSIGFSFYESYTKKKVQVPGQIKALFSLKLRTKGLLNISGTYMQSFVGDWQAKQIHVGCVKEGTQSRHESGGFSVNPARMTATVHGEWGREQSVKNHPVCYQFNILNLGNVDELHMYGGIIKANFGIGRIRKLVMHHQVDRGEQSGGGFGITFPLTPSAVSESALDAVKSVSVSISGGGMVRLNGGRCIFDVPGVEISNWQEFNIPDREYDTRTTVTGTWNNTRLGDSAPTGATAVGSIGMQVGDVHAHMDIPSGILPGHEARQHDWHQRDAGPDRKETEAAAEKRKAELMAKRKARTLTPEEAEELQPILDREAAERHARQQAQVDAIKAEEKALHDRIHAEAREKEQAERKEALKAKHKAGALTPSEREELQDLLDRDAAQRAAEPAVASSSRAEGEEVYDSIDHVLNQLQTPEQKFKAVCDILGVKTDGFTLDEMMAAHPSLKDKGVLQNAIHAADNFMADSANFVGDTYQEFKANNPEAAAVVEWVATKSMMLLYVGSLFTPAGLAVASALELAELTGLTDYAKENLTVGLKSAGFERSAEGMSSLIIGMLQSKGGKRVGALGANSKFLNELVGKIRNEVAEKFKHTRYVVPRDFELPKLLTVGKYQGPTFPTIQEHFGKHGLTMETYYGKTLKNIRDCCTGKGLKVNFRHDGVDKLAHIKRTGDNSFTLTVTTLDHKRIYTHFEGATKPYFLNNGITLPKGF